MRFLEVKRTFSEWRVTMRKQFSEIPGFETWENIEMLSKGWSKDKKYIIKEESLYFKVLLNL